MTRSCTTLTALLALLTAPACVTRPVEKPRPETLTTVTTVQPLFLDKEVDILFVIDNSGSMEQEQKNLAKQFPKLIEALQSEKLGNKLPNVRIGVVSTDLGAGNYNLPSCETSGGDAGKLQNRPQIAGCTAPKNPWISYHEGITNVPGSGTNAIAKVRDAFSCIAQLGVQGCGYEQPLEAARRALDRQVNVNPGFLRTDPLLAVIFITDEDDCSASNSGIFDPSSSGLTDQLGPLTSFRCFEFGVNCQCAGGKCDRTTMGARKNCVPGGKYLHGVQRYVDFFKNLKRTPDGKSNEQRVIMAAIAGPTSPVGVGTSDGKPALKASCQSTLGTAVPAIRLKSVVHSFAKKLSAKEILEIKDGTSNKPYFVDHSGVHREENFTSICNSDFSSALERVGKSIVGALGTMCLNPPRLTDDGGLLCHKGDTIGKNTAGQQVTCQLGCLEKAKFEVQEITGSGRASLARCPANLFDPKIKADQCGDACPCWRVVPNAQCASSQAGSSPYAVEVMRQGDAAKGTYLSVTTLAAQHPWGSKELADMPQCN